MSNQKTERTHFEDVFTGASFTHNDIQYMKVSGNYAELMDNSRVGQPRNSYFDGTAVVYAPTSNIRKVTRK